MQIELKIAQVGNSRVLVCVHVTLANNKKVEAIAELTDSS